MPHATLEISDEAKRRQIREIVLRLTGHSLEVLWSAAVELGHGHTGRAAAAQAAELGHRISVITGKARMSSMPGDRQTLCRFCAKPLDCWHYAGHLRTHDVEILELPSFEFSK